MLQKSMEDTFKQQEAVQQIQKNAPFILCSKRMSRRVWTSFGVA